MKIIGYDSDYAYGDFGRLHKSLYNLKKKVTANKTGTCCYCKVPLNQTNYTKDHLYPKSMGGKDTRPCCLPCNRQKANMTLKEYLSFLKRKKHIDLVNGTDDPLSERKIKSCKQLIKYESTRR